MFWSHTQRCTLAPVCRLDLKLYHWKTLKISNIIIFPHYSHLVQNILFEYCFICFTYKVWKLRHDSMVAQLVELLFLSKTFARSNPGRGPFWVEIAYSLSSCMGFLQELWLPPTEQNMTVRAIGLSNLSLGVWESEWLWVCVHVMDWRPVKGVPHPSHNDPERKKCV